MTHLYYLRPVTAGIDCTSCPTIITVLQLQEAKEGRLGLALECVCIYIFISYIYLGLVLYTIPSSVSSCSNSLLLLATKHLLTDFGFERAGFQVN